MVDVAVPRKQGRPEAWFSENRDIESHGQVSRLAGKDNDHDAKNRFWRTLRVDDAMMSASDSILRGCWISICFRKSADRALQIGKAQEI